MISYSLVALGHADVGDHRHNPVGESLAGKCGCQQHNKFGGAFMCKQRLLRMSWCLGLKSTEATVNDDTHPWQTNGVTMGGTSCDHWPMRRRLRLEVRPLPLLRQLQVQVKLRHLPFFCFSMIHFTREMENRKKKLPEKKRFIKVISIFQFYIFHSLKGTLNWQASLGPCMITLLSFKSVFHQPKQPNIFATKTPLLLIPSTVTICHNLVSLGCLESLVLL